MEAGACFELWLDQTLTKQEKYLLRGYEEYLHKCKFGYSFMHSFKIPKYSVAEKKQLLNTIGYIPEEVIYVCGLATPLFRSIEAILKFYGGYLKMGTRNILKNHPDIKGRCFTIRKKKYLSNILLASSYQLIDWEIVGLLFNCDDPPEIKEIYSIQNYMN
jgi:hypothetical protein